MAAVDVAVSSALSPERAWELASDLGRFGEWLTIFGGWKGEVPADIGVDTRVSSLIKVKGFRNTIHWRVTRYDEPKEIEVVCSAPRSAGLSPSSFKVTYVDRWATWLHCAEIQPHSWFMARDW